MEWDAGPGLRFFQTSVRSSSPGRGPPGQQMNDPFAPIFQSFSTIMEGAAGTQRQPTFTGTPTPPGSTRQHGSELSIPRFQNHHFIHGPWNPPSPGSAPGSPLREGSPAFGSSRHTYTARLRPRDANNAQPQNAPVDHLQGFVAPLEHFQGEAPLTISSILGQLLQSINGMNQTGPNGSNPGGPNSPLHLFAQLLNPANAAHGDAVYTEEALDRVITQFMEQANGNSAPGPASPEAISRLPKREADKSMMGNDGKAECSVCMDNVDIGDEVTILPCSHWFHGDCVGAWLKEHDTCPHCRQGIMPKDPNSTQANAQRAPEQPPQGIPAYSTGQRTFQEQHLRPHDNHRRRSSARDGRNGGEGSSGGGGGFSGWVRDRWGRGNSDRN